MTPFNAPRLVGADPAATCRKIGYRSEADALAAIRQLRHRGIAHRPEDTLHVYRCETCDAIHVGHGRMA